MPIPYSTQASSAPNMGEWDLSSRRDDPDAYATSKVTKLDAVAYSSSQGETLLISHLRHAT